MTTASLRVLVNVVGSKLSKPLPSGLPAGRQKNRKFCSRLEGKMERVGGSNVTSVFAGVRRIGTQHALRCHDRTDGVSAKLAQEGRTHACNSLTCRRSALRLQNCRGRHHSSHNGAACCRASRSQRRLCTPGQREPRFACAADKRREALTVSSHKRRDRQGPRGRRHRHWSQSALFCEFVLARCYAKGPP